MVKVQGYEVVSRDRPLSSNGHKDDQPPKGISYLTLMDVGEVSLSRVLVAKSFTKW